MSRAITLLLGLLLAIPTGLVLGGSDPVREERPEAYLPLVPGSLGSPSPDATYTLPDGRTHTYQSWGPNALKAHEAWSRGITGKGVRVAVIDSGVDMDHPYLKDNIKWAYNACAPWSPMIDDNGHGTHVAGIVKQTAPDVDLYIIRALGSPCGANLADAFLAAARGPDGRLNTADDAHVVTASLGIGLCIAGVAPCGLYTAGGEIWVSEYNNAFTQIVNAGVVIVGSAGNSYLTSGTSAPAASRHSVAVAALAEGNGVASYSSNGRTDGNDNTISDFEVEVAAPGSGVTSSVPTGSCQNCHPSGYASLSGTSMAAPHVAGVFALMHQASPWTKSTAGVAAVRAQMRCGSQDLVLSGKLSAPGYDVSTGHGIPQVDALLEKRCIFTHTTASTLALAQSAQELAQRQVDSTTGGASGTVDRALGRYGADEKDYDQDGLRDGADAVNPATQSRVVTSGQDYLEAALTPGTTSYALAPDGTFFGVQSRTFTGTVRVHFDGTVYPAGADVITVLPGRPALADGTWVLKSPYLPALTSPLGMGTLKVHVAALTATVSPGLVQGFASGDLHLWNWHRQTQPSYTFQGGIATYPEPEQHPRYLRLYVGEPDILP